MKTLLDTLYKLFIKNIGFKLLSLLLAAFFWFIGMNVHDPAIIASFNVKLTLVNKNKITENNFYLLNEKELESTTINFLIRGRSSQIEELQKVQNDVKAVVDLSPIDISNAKDIGTPLSASVLLEFPSSVSADNYEWFNTYPPAVDIKLDRLVTKTLPIQLNTIDQAEDGFVAFTHLAEISPPEVRVSGAKSVTDTLSVARVQVDLDGLTDDIVTTAKVVLYDEENKEITTLDKNVEIVDVFIPVMKYARIPISMPITIGSVAEGYRLTNVSINLDYVEVTGTEADIAALHRINLEPIDVTGVSETLQKPYDLRGYLLNTQLRIREGTSQEVTVTVTVEKEEPFEFIPKDINIIGLSEDADITADIAEEPVIILRGLAADIAQIDPDSIKVSVDVDGLEEGIHEMPLVIEGLPTGISEAAEHFVNVSISTSIEEGEIE